MWIKRFLARNREFNFLNHSMGSLDRESGQYANNEVTLHALEGVSQEVMDHIGIDYFIPAIGNGSSVLGPGRIITDPKKIITFEHFQSGVAFELKYPGIYKDRFSIDPGTLSRHKLPGTSYWGIDFPHLHAAIHNGIVDDVIFVSDVETDFEYHKLTGRRDSEDLLHWDMELSDREGLGRSSRAGIVVAMELSKTVEDKNMIVIAYDKADRYDN